MWFSSSAISCLGIRVSVIRLFDRSAFVYFRSRTFDSKLLSQSPCSQRASFYHQHMSLCRLSITQSWCTDSELGVFYCPFCGAGPSLSDLYPLCDGPWVSSATARWPTIFCFCGLHTCYIFNTISMEQTP